ncbi:MAG: M81 family metallopeptidase [Pseudomonadota bacterium]
MPRDTQTQPVRIAVAQFVHEATTFSAARAGLGDFAPAVLDGDALLTHYDAIRSFRQVAEEHAGVEVVALRSFGEVIGGSSVGAITAEAFEHYTGMIAHDLRRRGPFEAVYLRLHGAAAVEGIARPEAELARRVREVVGPDVPIAGTFDPHGNEDEAFLRHADFSLAYKYFPHYDSALQGARAARLLIRAARGDYRVKTATVKPPIITPTVLQWTGQDPWMSIIQRALVWEAREPDTYVSVFFGFPWNDAVDAGATVQVMTNDDLALAQHIAEDMGDYMLRRRRALFSTPIVAPDRAVTQALEATHAGATPVVLADYSDRAGDATHILREILRQGLPGVLYATLRDERAVSALFERDARAGDPFVGSVGGFVVDGASGQPVPITGTISGLYEHGAGEQRQRYVAIAFGQDSLLVLSDQLVQITSPAMVRAIGIEGVDRYSTWVLKSRAHFRRGFDDNGYAKTIMIVDAPGPYLGTVHLDALRYENIQLREMFPFSEGGLDVAKG